MSDITIQVEGKSLTFEQQNLTANAVLTAAQKEGIPAAQDGVEKLILKGDESGKIYKGDDVIDLSDDKIFSIGPAAGGEFSFTVNGQTFTSPVEELIAADIIKMAQKGGAIPAGSPENWKLEGGGDFFERGEWVNLKKNSSFISIPVSATPVAQV